MVEQRSPKPCVEGSNPSIRATCRTCLWGSGVLTVDKEAVGELATDCWQSAMRNGLIDSGHELVLQVFKINPASISGKADSAHVLIEKRQPGIRITFVDASKEDVVRIFPERESV